MAQRFAYQQGFEFTEVILKGEPRYFIEGYISTTDPDKANEVLTDSAQDELVRQCLEQQITLDIDHEEWYDDAGKQLGAPKNSRIPVAKIVEAKRRDNGVWVRCEINKHSDRFDKVWNSIKEKFLHSFSVAFYPISGVVKKVGGQFIKFIDNLQLVNVTLTGSPINPNATFVPVMKAALKSVPATEVKSMEEIKQEPSVADAPVSVPEVKVEEVKTEQPVAEPAVEPSAELKSETMDYKKAYEDLKAEFAKFKSDHESTESKEEEKKEHEAETKSVVAPLGGQNVNVKAEDASAQLKSLQDEVASLKAKLAQPLHKGLGPQVNEQATASLKAIAEAQVSSMLDKIQ